jgi:glycosyltransferase involved in cell wall biosynthesis
VVKVLVYPHSMEIGGSQLNAVETAAAFRDRGHEVLVVSRPGPLVDTVLQLGLAHIPLDPLATRRPSPLAALQLVRLAKRFDIDLVHGYEWPPVLEAFGGPRLLLGLPVVATVNSGRVAPFLPRTLPLIVCAEDIRRRAQESGHAQVTVLEPTVDTEANSPGAGDGRFRSQNGLADGIPLVTVVSRLARQFKLEGLLAACDAVGELARSGVAVQLAIVGDGPERGPVQQAAAAANGHAGRQVVVLSGELQDPRPAYAAADVVLGMGSSALRAMAFAKPLVVQGERGFWELLTPESAHSFLAHGWYGLGASTDGRADGAKRLQQILRPLLADPASWPGLGGLGRRIVTERFSLDRAAALQEAVYTAAIRPQPVPAVRLAAEAGRSGAGVLVHQVRRKWQRRLGTVAVDDMNTVPDVAAPAGAR